jgi:hypothetical protein
MPLTRLRADLHGSSRYSVRCTHPIIERAFYYEGQTGGSPVGDAHGVGDGLGPVLGVGVAPPVKVTCLVVVAELTEFVTVKVTV